MEVSKSIMIDFIMKNKYKASFLVLFCSLECLLVNVGSNYSSILAIVAIVLSLLWDKDLPMALFVSSSLYKVDMGTMGNAIVYLIIAMLAISAFNNKSTKSFDKFKLLWLYFVVIAIITHLVGINSSITTTISIIVKWMGALYIAYMVIKGSGVFIIMSLFFSGIGILVYQLINPVTSFSYYYDELVFNTKDIATAVAIPFFVLLWRLMNHPSRFVNKIIEAVLMIICITTIVLTYSRGVIIALFFSSAYILFSSKNKYKVVSIVIMVLALVGFIMIQEVFVDYELLTSNLEGGNGRTNIWNGFYQSMKNDGFVRILFGSGPNGLSQLTVRGTYAHSAILDYFFSYGLFGLSFIVTVLIITAINLNKRQNKFYISMFILDVMMYVTHGNCSETQFLMLLGICMGASCVPKENRISNYQ